MKHAVLAAILVGASWVTARAADPALRTLAEHVVGGASLMRELGRDESFDRFYEEAVRFADLARGETGPGDAEEQWRRVRSAYRATRRTTRRSKDDGWRFLIVHLEEDLAAGDRLLRGRGGAEKPSAGTGEPRRLSLIRSETCFGRTETAHTCPNRRDSLTFALPRDVAVIRRFDVEWRDHGADAKGELYVNDRLVWREDVNKDWDGDGKDLNLRLAAGSVITLRSSNGDPVWVRKLTVDVLDREDRDDYRDPWNLPWDPWR